MATLIANSIELNSELLSQAKQYAAEEGRPVEETVEDALRLYMEVEPRYNAILRKTRKATAAAAVALGLTPDEYVEKVLAEDKLERRHAA